MSNALDIGLDGTPEWVLAAACASILDDELWFPPKGGNTKPAKAVCASCPVRTECLRAALENNERFGIWGGYSERERRRMIERNVA